MRRTSPFVRGAAAGGGWAIGWMSLGASLVPTWLSVLLIVGSTLLFILHALLPEHRTTSSAFTSARSEHSDDRSAR